MPVLQLQPTIALWTDEAAPAVSHGGEADLFVKAVAGSARYSMVKFDITQIPAGATVIDAVLRFYFTAAGPAGALLSVYKCTSAWDEADDWNNNPTVDATPLSIAAAGLPVANSWENFTSDYATYDADDGVGSPRWHMLRQVVRWFTAVDVNHGVLLKATNGVGAGQWDIVGRTGLQHIVPILEITYADADTLPAAAGGDRRAFVGDALAELNASHITDVDFNVVIEMDPDDPTKDLDVTDDFIAGPTLRRKMPFVGEKMDMGNFNFQLSNKDGKYSPTNRDSDLWLDRARGRGVVVKATVKDQEVTLYEGVISDVPQHGDKRVEIMTTPRLRTLLDYSLRTAMKDYTEDPWLPSTVASANPADMYYTLLHNYAGVADADINLASFVAAKAEWTAQGLLVHATWDGRSAWDEIQDLMAATLSSLYRDFRGRYALKVWKPANPSAVELKGAESFRLDKPLQSVKNHITIDYNRIYLIQSWWIRTDPEPQESQTISDPESDASWGTQHMDLKQSYIRTPETARFIGRLYCQAFADPVERLVDVKGSIGWIQHDLDDGVTFESEDERIDETYIVIQQDIDIKSRSMSLDMVKANWPTPRRDWVTVLNWYSGAMAESFTAGMASPVASSVTGPTLLTDGSMRIVLGWTYDDTEIPHDGFAVLVNMGATDPGVPTLQSHDALLLYPRNMRFAILETAADQHVSFAVAAFRGTEANPYYGTFVTSAAAPDWQNLSLDGAVQAASVPTNVPVFSAGTAIQQEDGSTEYKITWTYVQGAIPADGFFVLGRYGNAAPGLPTLATNDVMRNMGPDARSTELLGARATLFGSFGVVAYRNTIEGPAFTAVTTNAGWTDLQADTEVKIELDRIRMPSDTTVTANDFLASIIVFKDQYWNAGGAASATTPPERTFNKADVGVEVYYYIKSTFRKRAGYNLLRLTAYMKWATTWAGSNKEAETVIRIMDYTGVVQQDRVDTTITDAAYTRNSHDLDISGLTDGEIYQVWIGYQISHQAGGAGDTDIWIWAPIVEVRPD